MTVYRLEPGDRISLRRVCRLSGTRPAWVAELVAQGVVEVRGRTPAQWHFDEEALGRLLRARRLERDLGLNAAGIALALELTEEVQRLRRHLRVLRTEAEPFHEQD